MENKQAEKLTILWTNADKITSQKMVFMYAKASMARNWWKSVNIIVWGATAKLVAEDKDIQQSLKEVKDAGVNITFCISCARELGVIDKIQSLGYKLKPMGEPLTEILKSDEKLITI